MPRQHRTALPDGLFHITARGNRHQPIFLVDGDWRFFLAVLDRVRQKARWQVRGYCLLDTHYHLLVESSTVDLSFGMQRLNGVYAQCFNSIHGLDGHLFQGRFHAGSVEADGHLLELTRYLALNPVRAGLCTAPAQWPWSSYPALIGLRRPDPFLAIEPLLSLFSPRHEQARRILRRFVIDAPAI